MRREPTQLVQLGIEASGDDATVAGDDRGSFDDRALQEIRVVAVFAQRIGQRLQARRIERREQLTQ